MVTGPVEGLGFINRSVSVSDLEASLGAPARQKAQRVDLVDWGYLLVELEDDTLVARGAVYVDQPDY